MRHELLHRFLDEHPEYFEGTSGSMSLRGDLRSVFEEYAQAMDPDEYEELRREVEAYRKTEKSRLQQEIESLVKQRKKEQDRLNEIIADMSKLESEVNRLEAQLNELTQSQHKVAGHPGRVRSGPGLAFLAMDFLGVVFLYIGIILKERFAASYVALGLFSLLLGFILRQGSAQTSRVTNPAMERIRDDLSHKWNEMRQIFKVKSVTLVSRKKSALSKIDEVNRKIEYNLNKINEYNRE